MTRYSLPCVQAGRAPRQSPFRRTMTLLAAIIPLFVLALPSALASPTHVQTDLSLPSNDVHGLQSCNDAYDRTGLGGAGIGQLRATSNGEYSFSITLNDEFIASLPPTTMFLWGQARVSVNGKYAFSIETGHVHSLHEAFHSHIQLQGYPYGPGNKSRIQRGDRLSFGI